MVNYFLKEKLVIGLVVNIIKVNKSELNDLLLAAQSRDLMRVNYLQSVH